MADTDSLDEPFGPDMWDAAVRMDGGRRRNDAKEGERTREALEWKRRVWCARDTWKVLGLT